MPAAPRCCRPLSLVWYLAIGATALIGLALAVRAGRRGDEAAGSSFTALTALLVSPISWTHHWTIAVPTLLLLARRAHERRSWPLAITTSAIALLGYSYLPESERAAHRGMGSSLSRDPYVLVALVAIVAPVASAAFKATRDRSRQAIRPTPSDTPNGIRTRDFLRERQAS
jgi:hypothetical protein